MCISLITVNLGECDCLIFRIFGKTDDNRVLFYYSTSFCRPGLLHWQNKPKSHAENAQKVFSDLRNTRFGSHSAKELSQQRDYLYKQLWAPRGKENKQTIRNIRDRGGKNRLLWGSGPKEKVEGKLSAPCNVEEESLPFPSVVNVPILYLLYSKYIFPRK